MVSLEQSYIQGLYFTIQMILYLISNNTEIYEGVVSGRKQKEEEETVVVVVDDDTDLPLQDEDDESGEDGVGDPLAGVRPQSDEGELSEPANMEMETVRPQRELHLIPKVDQNAD